MRILIVEDEPAHAEGICRALRGADQTLEIRWVDSLRAFQDTVAGWIPDLVLLDQLLPDGTADRAIPTPPETGSFPIVVMTSHGDEKAAVAAIQRGAMDYVVKSQETFADMPHTVRRALRAWGLLLERQSAREALHASEQRYRGTLESMLEGCQIIGVGLALPLCESRGRQAGSHHRGRALGPQHDGSLSRDRVPAHVPFAPNMHARTGIPEPRERVCLS